MIFDSNTYLGHYPFRKTYYRTAFQLRDYLKGNGIDRAIVSSMPAVFYRDCMEGNLELLEEISGMQDFFEPAAVINPTYPGWQKDMERLHEQYGVRVVKLFPYAHNYFLTDSQAVKCLKFAGDLKMVVSLPASIENPLQRHCLDANRFICEEELVGAASMAPDTTFILHNSSAFLYAKAERAAGLKRKGKILYDFSRVDEIAQDTLTQTVEAVGEDRIVFGSGAPLTYVDTQLVKIWFMQRRGDSQDCLEGYTHKNLEAVLEGK